MKKKYILLSMALMFVVSSSAQKLRFNSNREFKIVQFTDTHFKNGFAESDAAIKLINQILDSEKPDLVVLTGDIVIDPAPVLVGWAKIIEPMQKRSIPFAAVCGNHDDENGTSRDEITQWLMNQQHCLNKPGDYVINIYGSNYGSRGSVKTMLYMIDSHSMNPDKSIGGYAYITKDQIEQYIATSNKAMKRNRKKPVPSLAFFHIPLPEYHIAYNNKQHNAIGIREEDECSPRENSGFFDAIKRQGDVMGCFVGHDHDNDYIAFLDGIALGYGRYSGGKTTYTNLPNGARIIILKQDSRSFKTYIRTSSGDIIHDAQYPPVK